MSELDPLLDIQELDSTAAGIRHRLDQMPEKEQLRAKEQELADIEPAVTALDEREHDIGRTQKRHEDEIAGVDDKRQKAHDTLYSGAVNATRELEALQEEIAGFDAKKESIEDEILELMEAREEVESERQALAASRERLEGECQKLHGVIAEQGADSEAELADTLAKRDAAAASIPPEVVAEYEKIRSHFGGQAVAKLIGQSCEGCPMQLPAMEAARIRTEGKPLAHCTECGRMVVL